MTAAPGGLKRVRSAGALRALPPRPRERPPAASAAASAAALVNAAAAVVSSAATIASAQPVGAAQTLSAAAALAAGCASIIAAAVDGIDARSRDG